MIIVALKSKKVIFADSFNTSNTDIICLTGYDKKKNLNQKQQNVISPTVRSRL
ncbi:hypothetical protein H1P_1420013 [Hyella patelloides LEGE 07179]|uniref:Uncharacterized protein n=1 Tax=Hyella patelloides LEGE 07179 TaxID=945734 RepID=A0A563VLW3_9CYAN|nr:hypothetical protein H1P_1420013 [Hyella patelloides LEGE 07179]